MHAGPAEGFAFFKKKKYFLKDKRGDMNLK